jgi:hypothetical protein
MGECQPSATFVYEEAATAGPPRISTSTSVEFWDRNYPHDGDEPRVNLTAEDVDRSTLATSGLVLDQVIALHHVLGLWIERQ